MSSEGRRERKIVTVLFADLVGFTSRAEALDPEDVEAILRPYHARLREELERFGGTVEKFIGDAVMAVFGAPVTHEDDPERAVRAALAIRDWIREEGELEIRLAVNTGQALVSLGARLTHGESLVTGDVANTASRLQTAAPVNGVLVGEATYRATERVIRYREAAPVEAKGKAAPVEVWEPVEPRSRLGVDVARPRTQLIGREGELELLRGSLARARHERSPQLITLVGVPGIGKTRLVQELFETVEADPELIFWRQGRCLPYGDGVALWALGEIVKAHAGVLDGEPAESAARKLRAVVDEAAHDETEAAWIERHLRPLLGLETESGVRSDRNENFASWRRFFEGLAEQSPLVLVFDDLHWADEGLLDFVDHLVDWSAGVPLLVVAAARPELLSRRPDWGGGKPNAATVSLSPLSDQETARLVHGLLDRAVLPVDLQAALVQHSGGNPLYAEEFARIAGERGAGGGNGGLPLPETVQGLIAARLDSLGASEKVLLQDASVVGRSFWLGAVAALGGRDDRRELEDRLHGLERKEFLQRERRSAVEGETEYAFSHALVRDVAYSQIPRADRAEKHERAAAWIESLGRAEDHADMRAHHYLSALEAAKAAGRETPALAKSTRSALRGAGERAFGLNAFDAAAHYFDRALELTPEPHDDRPELMLGAARARFELGDWRIEELTAARDALLAAGETAGAAQAEVLAAEVAWTEGRGDEVPERLARAEELAEPLPTSPTKASVYTGLCRIHWLGSREEVAFRLSAQALAMAEELGLAAIRAQLLSMLGTARSMKGDLSGLDSLRESISIFEELGSPDAQRPYNNLADTLYRLGQIGEAAEVTARMSTVRKRFPGFPEWRRWNENQEVRIHYSNGEWDEALELTDREIAELEAGTRHYLEPDWRIARARIRFARGDAAGAEEDTGTAIERARAAGDAQLLIPSLALHARLLSATGRPETESVALELVEVCRRTPPDLASDWFPEAAVALVALDRAGDVEALAETASTPTPWLDAGLAIGDRNPAAAARLFAEMGALPYEAEAWLLAAQEGADVHLDEPVAFFRKVGATHYLREAEALLVFQARGARLKPGSANL
jgi:class 3 adenylate cyclase/tetratricopeptide (TPR) repeat protein